MNIRKTISKSLLYGVLFWSWFNFVGAGILPIFYTSAMPSGNEDNFQSNPLDIGAHVIRSNNQIIPKNAVPTAIQFNVEDYDTDNLWSSSSNTSFVANHPGRYMVFGSVYWGFNSPYPYINYLYFRKNGIETIGVLGQLKMREAGSVFQDVVAEVTLEIGDYVELIVINSNTTNNIQVNASGGYTPTMYIQRIGMGVDFMIVALAFATILMLSLLVINVFYKQPAFKFAIFFLCIAIAALYYQAGLEGNAFVTVAVMIIGGYNLWAMTKAERKRS